MICTVALMRHGGSHLIRPIVAVLGVNRLHEPGKDVPLDHAEGPVIVFLRDPRNRMVATWRWWSQKPRKAAAMLRGGADADEQIAWLLSRDGGGFLPEMLRWARIWCHRPDALTVRFETICADGCAEVARIAEHLGLPADAERDIAIFKAVYGHGRTYTGKHSDWRETFGPASNAMWDANGGPELIELMGYA